MVKKETASSKDDVHCRRPWERVQLCGETEGQAPVRTPCQSPTEPLLETWTHVLTKAWHRHFLQQQDRLKPKPGKKSNAYQLRIRYGCIGAMDTTLGDEKGMDCGL